MAQHTAEATEEQSQTQNPAGKLVRTSGGFVWHIDDKPASSNKVNMDDRSTRRTVRSTVRESDGDAPRPHVRSERDVVFAPVDEQQQRARSPFEHPKQYAGESPPDSGPFRRPGGASKRCVKADNVRFHVVSTRRRRPAANTQKSAAFKRVTPAPAFKRVVPVWSMVTDRVGKAAKRFEAAPTTFTDHFRRGALAGLVLGCLSLILFHQVALPAASAALSGQVENPPSASPALAPVGAFQVTLPSAKVYMLGVGPFASISAADAARKQLGQAGATAQLMQGKAGYSLWVNAALARQDAMKTPAKLSASASKTKSSVQSVRWSAESLSTTAVDSNAGVDAANKWLATIVTALRVETGAVAGETASRDVRQAVQNAAAAKPADSIWSTGSVPTSLEGLYNRVTKASTLLTKNQPQQAEGEILKAWAALYASHQQALAGN